MNNVYAIINGSNDYKVKPVVRKELDLLVIK